TSTTRPTAPGRLTRRCYGPASRSSSTCVVSTSYRHTASASLRRHLRSKAWELSRYAHTPSLTSCVEADDEQQEPEPSSDFFALCSPDRWVSAGRSALT